MPKGFVFMCGPIFDIHVVLAKARTHYHKEVLLQ
ncbi:hypothetical protein NK6_6799 [Bradyrhizobium diazoefficiens]|uniref:Uncharacterized protein n=1 Tax=Bradyrhizobium diazoefficiens TaxID=1355477 RepID=A0A0E3VVY1_9BRAD|nr:hypothetical protein NK6_6799 [Bradyrhizobium diazoefficiens]